MPSLIGTLLFSLTASPGFRFASPRGFAHGVPLHGTQESGLLHPGSAQTFAARLQPCPLHEILGFAHVGYVQRPAARDSSEPFTFEAELKRILTQTLFLNTSLQRMICVPIVLSLPSSGCQPISGQDTSHQPPVTSH